LQAAAARQACGAGCTDLIARNLDLDLKDHLTGPARPACGGRDSGFDAKPVIGPDPLASPRNDQTKQQKPGVSAGLLIV
jgi:hypothetical protein